MNIFKKKKKKELNIPKRIMIGDITYFPDHYRKVYNKLSHKREFNGFLPDHELAPTLGSGKKVIFPDFKKVYIDSVYKHWSIGYYYTVLYYTFTEKGQRSHGSFHININSVDPIINELSKENLMFVDSTLQEKLDIIIEKRKEQKLPLIIHINSKDAKNMKTFNVENVNINDLVEYYKYKDEVVFISGGTKLFKCDKFDGIYYIELEGLKREYYNDISFFSRNYEI